MNNETINTESNTDVAAPVKPIVRTGDALRKVNYNGTEMYTCPNGCDESELELGKDKSSFMAMIGAPYKYIRCGECGFGEESRNGNLKIEIADVIVVWNKTCEAYSA